MNPLPANRDQAREAPDGLRWRKTLRVTLVVLLLVASRDVSIRDDARAQGIDLRESHATPGGAHRRCTGRSRLCAERSPS